MHTIVSCYQEYLLGVLDIMTKSTDQLISAFHKLYIFVCTFDTAGHVRTTSCAGCGDVKLFLLEV